jgi:pyrimidine operon attenuation protein/uracil phosphoribosyltransferase
MKIRTSPAYSQKNGNPLSYNIIGDLEVSIRITGNAYGIPPDRLFQMAARMNKKRGFLFVSKVLGKHLPVRPHVSLLAGASLGLLYREQLGASLPLPVEELLQAFAEPETASRVYDTLKRERLPLQAKTLFIGFAETATSLGHSMFEMFGGAASYLHTTRESIDYMRSCIDFEEEHSHATTHRCFALDPAIFEQAETIVLVDDEMTTGKTAINIIQDLTAKYGPKNYVLASLLDWRSQADLERFAEVEEELGIKMQCLSLLTGEIAVSGSPVERTPESAVTAAAATAPQISAVHVGEAFRHIASRNDGPAYLRHTGRFGLTAGEQDELDVEVGKAAALLDSMRTGDRTLCMGTGEFMYIPMRIASLLSGDVWYQSSTRSPIHPYSHPDYAIHAAFRYASPEHEDVINFMYNIPYGHYEELFLFMEREIAEERLTELYQVLGRLGITRIHIVYFSHLISEPDPLGSYRGEDVRFLLKDLSGYALERRTEEREAGMQSGAHYSESLPIEYEPTPPYIELFHKSLEQSADALALAIGTVSEKIVRKRGLQVVLASLARGGTPIGVLIRRYVREVYDAELPHYSLSIIRGKGIDENALLYIHQRHPEKHIQFVDGWTGKGAIRKVMIAACVELERKYGLKLSDDLAVLADPGHCTATFGTRDDYLIPSACLNATVSGLISRTVLRSDLIGPGDFHGAKYYRELSGADLTNVFVDTISARFGAIREQAKRQAEQQAPMEAQGGERRHENRREEAVGQRHERGYGEELERKLDQGRAEAGEPAAAIDAALVTWQGWRDIERIKSEFNVPDINFIKPGVGETTRVLLRRVPWKILVDSLDNPNLQHIRLLAEERGVAVEEYPHMSYSCCGIIKALKGDQE